MRTALSFFLFAFFSAQVFAGELIWKTEAELEELKVPEDECKEEEPGCGHFVHHVYVSRYGRRYFMSYAEGTRAHVSFDRALVEDQDQASQIQYSAEQIAPGAFDWGGVVENGKFKPLYVIKRFYEPGFDWSADHVDRNKSGLYVWRLSNPPAARITESIGLATENAKARELAVSDFQSLRK